MLDGQQYPEPSRDQIVMLLALSKKDQVYAGGYNEKDRTRRRAKAKVARKSRREGRR